MQPFKALIVPLKAPSKPPIGGGGDPAYGNQDLPLFPFVPIVVPPGGTWPGEPPTGGGGNRPWHELPLFPFNPIVVPPGGAYPPDPTTPPVDPNAPHPDQTLPGDLPTDPTTPPVDPNAPYPDQTLPGDLPPDPTEPPTEVEGNVPTHPINLPPSKEGWWILVYVPGQGWSWVAISPQPLPPKGEMPAPKKAK